MNTDNTNKDDIRVIYKTPEFNEFFDRLPDKTKIKFEHVFNVIQTIHVLPIKFVKRLVDTDLYEMRVSVGTNEYRTILFTMDNDNIIEAKEIILLNGFLKKSEKDYKKQINIAMNILNNLAL